MQYNKMITPIEKFDYADYWYWSLGICHWSLKICNKFKFRINSAICRIIG